MLVIGDPSKLTDEVVKTNYEEIIKLIGISFLQVFPFLNIKLNCFILKENFYQKFNGNKLETPERLLLNRGLYRK